MRNEELVFVVLNRVQSYDILVRRWRFKLEM